MPTTVERSRVNARALGEDHHQLAALHSKTVRELQALYLKLVGEPTRSHNREGLIKKLSWYVQRQVSGGLSPAAIERIAQLGDRLPDRWLMRQHPAVPPPPTPHAAIEPRDPRIPAVGTVLRRMHNGVEHAVTVCEQGFEYAGERFRTLSAVAKHIAGTPWSGFAFFGLNAPLPSPSSPEKTR